MLNSTVEISQGMTVEKEIKNYAVSFENARVAHERYLLKQQNEDLLEAVNQYLQTMKANPKMPKVIID